MRAVGRRGLSMLEMVLCLPILLFVMALMINFGRVACWKIRALDRARHAVWGTRSVGGDPRRPRRTGDSDPCPDYWPASAEMGPESAGPVPALDDPWVDLPVARGRLPYGATVKTELLDPGRGLREGSAKLTREFPLLPKMGRYHLEARTWLLDDTWHYVAMRMWSNRQRRIPVIYALAKAPAYLVNAYRQAVMDVRYAWFRPYLAPLDRDAEFIRYTGGAPDFHRRYAWLRSFRDADLERARELAAQRAERLADRIQGRPEEKDAEGNVTKRRIPSIAEQMARAFKRLYEDVIKHNRNPADIPQLNAKIELLRQFLARLQSENGA